MYSDLPFFFSPLGIHQLGFPTLENQLVEHSWMVFASTSRPHVTNKLLNHHLQTWPHVM
jgi:hypothetical protein